MADVTLTAPEWGAVSWSGVTGDRVGTAAVSWANRSGGTYASYSRVDLRVRAKAAPGTVYVLRTWSPYAGVNSASVTASNGWSALTSTEWEFEVLASGSGQTASSGWRVLAPLVTPTPTITGVTRESETSAQVFFTAPTGLAAPTSAHVARSSPVSDAGSSTPVNNVVLPATSVRLPLPEGAHGWRAWLSYHGPAGWSGKVAAAVPAWWVRPAAPAVEAYRTSDPGVVRIVHTDSGSGGSAATAFRVETAAPGSSQWSLLWTHTVTSRTTTLALAAGRQYRVTAINPGGESSPVVVQVEPWWQAVPGATDLVASRSAAGQIALGWSVPATSARNPLRSQVIRRRPVSGGDYQTVATLGPSVRTWTDTSTSWTSQWTYEVVTVGDMGWASTRPSRTVTAGMVAPDAPTSITWSRSATNPDAIIVAFSPRSSSDKPTSDVRLVSRDVTGRIRAVGDWVALSSLTTMQLTHTAGPNVLSAYSVEARNAGGVSSALTWTELVATTPLGPTTWTATRVGADVRFDWGFRGATIGTRWEFERSSDGGVTRFPVPGVEGGIVRTHLHAGVAYGVEHTYWMRPARDGAPDAAWVRAVAPVPAGAAPYAPTLVEPGWGEDNVAPTVEWEHRGVDGTPQAEARIECELWSKSSRTMIESLPYTVTGSDGTMALGVVPAWHEELLWRVQTRGTGSSLWSPWSVWSSRQFAARPTLTLDVPAVVTSQQVRGTISTGGGWVSAAVELLDAGGTVVARRDLTPATGTDFAFDVQDRAVYTVRATLHDGRLLSAPQTQPITVAWERPPAPRLTATAEGEQVRLDVGAVRAENPARKPDP